MNAYFNGQPIFGPRGPAGPDGNPIGTIISYMGLTAPKDYLVCDGAAYNIATYPELARFFEVQFGSKNHFGGDGTTTFAVPDLRNLFLRGYHGKASEQLSGEIGKKQKATEIPSIRLDNVVGGMGFAKGSSLSQNNVVINEDTKINTGNFDGVATTFVESIVKYNYASYTSRPVNAAVLYCIKAITSVPAEDAYSTEETRIGTWIDGKPIYRKVFTEEIKLITNTDVPVIKISDYGIDKIINIHGYIRRPEFNIVQLWDSGAAAISVSYLDDYIYAYLLVNDESYLTYYFIEYTKTTD